MSGSGATKKKGRGPEEGARSAPPDQHHLIEPAEKALLEALVTAANASRLCKVELNYLTQQIEAVHAVYARGEGEASAAVKAELKNILENSFEKYQQFSVQNLL